MNAETATRAASQAGAADRARRTKIPDESSHTPIFRVFTLMAYSQMQVDTYEVGAVEALSRHAYQFKLPRE
jgi:3',5'-cyclic-AMP phosphodiesterase